MDQFTTNVVTQFIYVSRARQPFSQSEIAGVIDISQVNNAKLNVTGALLYCNGHFLQMLEGDSHTVTKLYEKIAADPRHTDCESLLCKPVKKRMFKDWSMRLLNLDTRLKLDRQRMYRLITDIRERPQSASHGVEARVLLNDFAAQIQAA